MITILCHYALLTLFRPYAYLVQSVLDFVFVMTAPGIDSVGWPSLVPAVAAAKVTFTRLAFA